MFHVNILKSLKFSFFGVCLLLISCVSFGQTPILYTYTPEKKSNLAVIVCPGGSYYWLASKTEGSEVAEWLNENNITAYVLEYPTSGWASFFFHIRNPHRSQYPAQLTSLQNALKIVKNEGFEFVGVMGFSAGGHLALNSAIDLSDSLAPDFVTSIYPVITMNEPYVHKRSRRGLLGERRRRYQPMRDSLSLELHTDKIACPVFLMNCQDDPVVDYQNSELFYNSMLKNHNSEDVFYYQTETGGHGFGVDAAKTSSEAIKWKDLWLNWIEQHFNINILD